MLTTIMKDISPLLIKFCPVIATALGSPAAGTAVEILAKYFGIAADKPEDIVPAVLADIPAAKEILKKAEEEGCEGLQCLVGDNKVKSIEMNIKLNLDND